MTIQYTKNLSSLLSLDLFPQCQLETNLIPQPSFQPIKVVTGSNLTELRDLQRNELASDKLI